MGIVDITKACLVARVLTKTEWSSSRQGQGFRNDGPLFPACPICNGCKPGTGAEQHFEGRAIGHSDDCEMFIAINKAKTECL